MTDEKKPDVPKIISLRSRQAYTPPAEPAVDEGKPADNIDHESIAALEQVLADMKAGEIQGLAAVVWDNEANFFRRLFIVPVGPDAGEFSHRLLGGVEVLREAAMESVLYVNEYASLGELLAEEDQEPE